MSLENKVGRAVLDLLEVTKSRLAADLLLARTEGRIIIGGENELNNLITTVNASLDVTFDSGVTQVLRTVRENETATKPKRKTTRKPKS